MNFTNNIFGKIRTTFDAQFWLTLLNTLKYAYPVLIFLGGAIVLYLGFSLHSPFGTALGTAIVTSGVFSAVTTSRFMTRIFTTALSDVVYGRDFLSSRNDIDVIWRRVSDALCEKRFPELKDKIDENIIKNYLPKTRNFYYSSIDRHYKVVAISKDGNTITCDDDVHLKLKPHSGAKYIEYVHRFKPSEDGHVSESEVKVNGESIDRLKAPILVKHTSDGDWKVITIQLPPKEHEITRRRKSTIPLTTQPYTRVRYNTYVEKLRVNASSDISNIEIHLLNDEAFQPLDKHAANDRRISAENTHLIMPGEGHMLLFVKTSNSRNGRKP
jgi:hypothetical protein